MCRILSLLMASQLEKMDGTATAHGCNRLQALHHITTCSVVTLMIVVPTKNQASSTYSMVYTFLCIVQSPT